MRYVRTSRARNPACAVTVVLALGGSPAVAQTCAAPFTSLPASYTVDSPASGVTTGEFSRDSSLDFAVARSGENSIAIYTRNILYPDLFVREADAPAGGHVRNPDDTVTLSQSVSAIASGDFLEDGRTDLVVTHPDTNRVTVLERTLAGAVEFTPTSSREVGANPFDVAVADFDGDGHLDVVVSSLSKQLYVHLGDGRGLLGAARVLVKVGDEEVWQIVQSAPAIIPTTGDPLDVLAADLDGDGWQDIAVSDGSGVVVVRSFVGEETGSAKYSNARAMFFEKERVSLPFPVAAIAAGHLDRDAIPEIVAASASGDTLAVLRGDGKGSWTVVATVTKGNGAATAARGLLIGDFTGDGIGDVVATSVPGGTSSVTVLAGNGQGGFNAPSQAAAGIDPAGIAAALLDSGNSSPDLVVATGTGGTAEVLRNGCAVPTINVTLNSLEVTQVVQDLTNSVPLVAGKPTFVRAHVSSATQVAGVSARLRAYAPNGTQLGDALVPINAGGRITVKPDADRGRREDSFLFRLPDKWTAAGQVRLRVDVNPYGEIPETDTADNAREATVGFLATRKLRVELWSYVYYGTQGGAPFAVEPTANMLAGIESRIRRMLPAGQFELKPRVRKEDRNPPSFLFDKETLTAPLDGTSPYRDPDRPETWMRIEHLWRYLAAQYPELKTPGTLKVVALHRIGGDKIGIGGIPDWFSVVVNDDPDTAVHEIGHNLGRSHVQCSADTQDEDGPDLNYPYQYADYPSRVWGGIGGPPEPPAERTRFYGFDAGDASLASPALTLPIAPLRPAGSVEPVVGDLMSYCQQSWVSDYTYKAIREYLQQNFSAADPTGDFLRVVGTFGSAAGSAVLSASRLPQIPDLPIPVPGTHSLRLEAADSSVLASRSFTPAAAHDEGLWHVTEVLDFASGTRRVVLIGPAGQVLGSVDISASAPAVGINAIASPIPATGSTQVSWTASDLDGDDLHASIEYSTDAGANWSAVATGISGNVYEVNNSDLPGTHGAASGRLRVLVSDGVNTGHADSGLLAVAGKPPAIRIMTVTDGATFVLGQTVPLAAVSSDLEDGSNLPIEWASDRDGALGSGTGITPMLSAGTHVITAAVTDKDGQRTEALVTVNVESAPAPGSLPVADAGADRSAFEGDLVVLDGSGSRDAEGDSLLYAWSVEEEPSAGGEVAIALSGEGAQREFRALQDGAHRFLLQVDDQRHGTASDDVTISVQNASPGVRITSPADGALFKAGAVTVKAAFTDPGILDRHACSITWDLAGGVSDTGTIADSGAEGTCSGTRNLAAGVYETRITVTDEDGGAGSADVQIVVYDPTAGFVTGGATILSPAGALRSAPAVAGNAELGFVARYRRDVATVPSGELNFEFPAAAFHAHSESYQWIAVSGSKATLRGTAIVNKASGYRFQLEVQDGQLDSSGIDRFRLRILRLADGSVVYDNGRLMPLASGSIVLHK